jgi:NAD(P)-dependent dehydrogenase (short-subunit alcohol dehydrogenase family)
MSRSIEPRAALVTGGSRGIGKAIGDALTATGVEVVAPSRAELDLADPASVERFCADIRGRAFDILVNNAGINQIAAFDEVSEASMAATLQVNLLSAWRLTQAVAPAMAARGAGHVLNMSSILGRIGRAGRTPYSVTKSALDALTRSTAIEYGPRGVVANALAPGYIATELTARNNPPETIAALERDIPLRRLGTVAEIAALAVFLVSPENSYLTGQTIVIDGGYTCQ